MLVIRDSQLRLLGDSVLSESIAAHLRRHFEDRFAGMTREDLLKFVRSGIERARAYGIESSVHVCRFVDVMAVMGQDFDANPLHSSWVDATLRNRAIASMRSRVDALVAETSRRLGLEEATHGG